MLDKLLEFENNPEILSFRYAFNNELIWPFFRTMIYQNVVFKANNNKPQIIKDIKKENKFYNYIIKNPYTYKNKKILFLYGNTSNVLDENGMYFNRLFDYYADVYEKDTLMMESKYLQSHQIPRKFKNIVYEDFIERIIEISGNLIRKKYDSKDIYTIEKFLCYLQEKLPCKLEKGFYEGLRKHILDFSIKLKYYNYYYNYLFMNIKPKVIFFEDGCYGNKAYAIKLANELGIITAEFQHGYICFNHIAYNYPLSIFSSEEYKKYMPQYYLTYGQYWNENVRLPIKTRAIGNPHFYNSLNNVNKRNSKKLDFLKKYKVILLISCANCYKDYIELLKNISPKLNNEYKIILRLHPLERNSKKNYDCLKNFDNIIINDDGDIYEYINVSEYIISDSSTAIYEAIGFDKKILIFEDNDSLAFTPSNIGTWFKTAEELYDLLINNEKIKPMNDVTYYWENKWKENYINFIDDVTGGINE